MDIQPGDVIFTRGKGVVSTIIRYFTSSSTAHCGVVVDVQHGGLVTHEAFWPGGVKVYTHRNVYDNDLNRIYRIWRTPEEQSNIVQRSHHMVGKRYDLIEILRIINWGFRKMMSSKTVAFIALLLFLSAIFNNSERAVVILGVFIVLHVISTVAKHLFRDDNPDRVICSNHVAVCLLSAAPVELTYPSNMIWPGRLEQDLHFDHWRRP